MSREIALFLTAAPTTDLDVGQVVAAARNSCPPNVAMSRRQRIVVRSSHGRSVTVIYPTTGTCGVNTCFPRAVIRNFRGCLGRWSAALMAAVSARADGALPLMHHPGEAAAGAAQHAGQAIGGDIAAVLAAWTTDLDQGHR